MSIKKILFSSIFISLIFGSFLVLPAKSLEDGLMDQMASQLKAAAEDGAGYKSPQDPRIIVAVIIKRALQIIGIVFLVLILYAGFSWMTAGGNPDSVKKAKQIIFNSTIGLAIVLSAYALTTFIFFIIAQQGDRNKIRNAPTSQEDFIPFN